MKIFGKLMFLVLFFLSFGMVSEGYAIGSKEKFVKVTGKALPASAKVKTVPKDRPIVVISVDGGGVRGVVPITMIEEIEKELGREISQVGHFFTGTSAGSIIVALLNVPGEGGRPKYTAAEAVKISEEVIGDLFKKPLTRSIRTLGGLAGSKYTAKPLEAHLKRLLGETTVGTTLRPVLITSVDMKTKKPFLFSTPDAIEDHERNNVPLWMAVRSSTAAPTYFKPFGIELSDETKLALADGGLTANNPELLGLLKAMEIYPGHTKFIVISLATGKPAVKEKIKTKGSTAGSLLKMLKPTIDTALDAQSDLSQEMMKMITKGGRVNVEYHRIGVVVPKKCAALDNASPTNLKCLKDIAAKRTQDEDFKLMVAALKSAVGSHRTHSGSHRTTHNASSKTVAAG